MSKLGENLLTTIVLFVLAMLMYVIVIGGILCLMETDYSYQEYLSDLTRLGPIVIAAVLGAIGRAIIPLMEQRDKNRDP